MKLRYALPAGAVLLAALGQSLPAQVKWTGAAKGNLWSEAKNWSGDAVPASSDDVAVNGSTEAAPATVTSSQNVNNIQIGSGKETGAVLVQKGGSLSTNQKGENHGLFVGRDSGTGIFKQTGGDVIVDGGFHLGESDGSTGSYTISNGSLQSKDVMFVGRGGKATLNQAGGSISAGNQGHAFRLGEAPSARATYNMSGGNLSVARHMVMGHADALDINATWNISGKAMPRVGAEGEGSLDLRGNCAIHLSGNTKDGGSALSVSGSFNFYGPNTLIGITLDKVALKQPKLVRNIVVEQDLRIESAHNYVLPTFAEGVLPREGTWLLLTWGRDMYGLPKYLQLHKDTAKGWSLNVDEDKQMITVTYGK